VKFLGSIFVLLAMWASVPTTDGGLPGSIQSSTAIAARLAPVDPAVDSASAEFEAGRYWHAGLILRERVAAGVVATPVEVLLLARADAGWRNWEGVLTGLGSVDWLDDVGDG